MKISEDRYGINIQKYLARHEAYIAERIQKEDGLPELLDYHRLKLSWLQHERLIHLIVLVLSVIIFCIALAVNAFFPGLPAILFLIIITILMAAYILHYFRLENRTQHWYRLYDEIYQRLR